MRSKFAIHGHPIHPMLVALPIGLFLWTLVADIVYLSTDHDRTWYEIAFWTGVAAWVSALVAALPGLGDYLAVAVKSDARGMATGHMVLNVAVVGLYFVAWLLMLDNGAVDGDRLAVVTALHAAGSGLLLLSGWLGGEMVYRHHLGMVADTGELERSEEARHTARRVERPEAR